jgi:hypothetical protein
MSVRFHNIILYDIETVAWMVHILYNIINDYTTSNGAYLVAGT